MKKLFASLTLVAFLAVSGLAYAQATGADPSEARDILTRYRQDFKSSIEDFADKVKAYIDAQQPGLRLNFFVDEVGQYIADNVKLMTNLQTIAESLNTKCRGRSPWVRFQKSMKRKISSASSPLRRSALA